MKNYFLLIIAASTAQMGAMIHLPPQAPVQAICHANISRSYCESDHLTSGTAEKIGFTETAIARAIKEGDFSAFYSELSNKGWRGWVRWLFAQEGYDTARAWRCLRYALDLSIKEPNKAATHIIPCLCDYIMKKYHHLESRADREIWQSFADIFWINFKADERKTGQFPQITELMDFICKHRANYQECDRGDTHGQICYSFSVKEMEESCADRAKSLSRDLWYAAEDGQVADVNKLLDRGAEINQDCGHCNYYKGQSIKGIFLPFNSTLCCAVTNGHVEVVDLLICRGAQMPPNLVIPENQQSRDWKEVLHDLAVEIHQEKKKKKDC